MLKIKLTAERNISKFKIGYQVTIKITLPFPHNVNGVIIGIVGDNHGRAANYLVQV